jgi:hypothetical protein
MNWTSQGQSWRIVAFFGIASLIASGVAQAQTRQAEERRKFAELLARRHSAAREAAVAREASFAELRARRHAAAAAREAASRVRATEAKSVAEVKATRPDKATAAVDPAATRNATRAVAARLTRARDPFNGFEPGTPYLVPSGFGVGRDGFVDGFYELAFGRDITQQELDHLSRILASGVSPQALAAALWNSPERKLLVREGLVPNVTFKQAYQNGINEGNWARRFNFNGI